MPAHPAAVKAFDSACLVLTRPNNQADCDVAVESGLCSTLALVHACGVSCSREASGRPVFHLIKETLAARLLVRSPQLAHLGAQRCVACGLPVQECLPL